MIVSVASTIREVIRGDLIQRLTTSVGEVKTNVNKVNAIKKINERAAELDRQAKSGQIPQYIADQYRAAMQAASKGHLTKSGNISHGTKATEDISDEVLTALLSKDTAGAVKKGLREGAKKEEMDYSDYVSMVQEVREAANETPQELSDAINAYGAEAKKGQHTPYVVLRKALKQWRSGRTKTPSSTQAERYFGEAPASFSDSPFVTPSPLDVGSGDTLRWQ